jgi:hypothetical protein
LALTTGVTHTRIRLFDIGANRGPGNEVAIVYDAKNIGSEVMANDEGSAYWTLPINHALINQFQPLLRHYKIERLNHNTGTYDLVGAGLLTGADVTNDEIVFSGSDYMGILNTYYTEVLGAAADATTPLVYDTGGISALPGSYTYDSATAGVGRSASFIVLGSSQSSVTSDWNSNDTEAHLPTGTSTVSYNINNVVAGTSTFEVQISGTNIIPAGNTIVISGYTGSYSSRINGTHTVYSATTGTFTITSAGSSFSSLNTNGTVTAMAYTHRSLLKFDLTTNAAWSTLSRIKKATLKLYGSNTTTHVNPSSTTSRNLEVRRATSDWTGDTTTGAENAYSNSSNATCDAGTMFSAYAGTAVTKAFTGVSNNALYEFDVTTFVSDWKSGAATNHGFHMKNSGELVSSRGITFFSTAYSTTAYRPKLYIEYETDTATSNGYDVDGLFKATSETKTYIATPRISGREPLLSKNTTTSALADRTPISMYFLDKSSDLFSNGNYWPSRSFFPENLNLPLDYNTNNATTGATPGATTDTNMNRFVVKYDEENEKYILSGILRIERSKENSTTNRWSDYIKGTSIYANFTVNDIVLHFASSPGGELFSVYLWKKNNTADGYAALSANPHRSLEIPFWVEVFPWDTTTAKKVDPPTAPASDTSVEHPATGTVVGGLTRYAVPATAQYRVPILLTGQAYEFQVMATASITDTGGDHELRTAWVNAYNQDKSPMSLRSETLQSILSRYLTTVDKGAFDKKDVGGIEVGRLNWATVENVNASGWPTDKLRYFTTGENITDFLRNIGDKQMSENGDVDLEGVGVPGRVIMNFVGVRKANGNPADASKFFINPNMIDQPVATLEYPGVIGAFRYNADGRRLRNDIRLIPASAYLSGAYTNMSNVRLKGVTEVNEQSQQIYGLAPVLTAQQGFIDESDAQRAAKRSLEQREDFDVASTLTIQLERDKLNPFKDFFLGDAVRVFVRRDNVNVTNSFTDLLAGIYIIAGVVYKVGTDGAEDVTLQLLNSKYFAAVSG